MRYLYNNYKNINKTGLKHNNIFFKVNTKYSHKSIKLQNIYVTYNNISGYMMSLIYKF